MARKETPLRHQPLRALLFDTDGDDSAAPRSFVSTDGITLKRAPGIDMALGLLASGQFDLLLLPDDAAHDSVLSRLRSAGHDIPVVTVPAPRPHASSGRDALPDTAALARRWIVMDGDLDAAERRYQAVVQHGLENVSILREDGKALYQSVSIGQHLGLPPDTQDDEPLLRVHPDDTERVRAAFQRAIDHPNERVTVEYRYVLPDGSWRWLESTGTNLLGDPVVGGVVVTSRDVTEAKRHERDARLLSEASATLGSSLDYHETLDRVARLSLPDFADWCTITLLDEHGAASRVTVAHVDPARQRVAGELLRAPFDLGVTQGVSRTLMAGATDFCPVVDVEAWAQTVDDEMRRILLALGVGSWLIAPMTLRGEVIGALAFMYGESGRRYSREDIVIAEEIARRAATAIDNARLHQKARAAEERYRSVVEQVPATMFIERYGGGLVYVSPHVQQLFGYSADELLSAPELWTTLTRKADEQAETDGARSRSGDDVSHSHSVSKHTTRDGRTIWTQSDAVLQYDESGNPSHWQGFITDITAQKETERRFRALVQHAIDGVTVLAEDGSVIYQSESVRRVLGYEPQALAGANVFGLMHPDDVGAVKKQFADLLEQPDLQPRVTYRFLHGDGSWRWMESNGRNLLAEPAVGGIVVTTRDITDHKAAEADMATLASIVSSLSDAVTGADREGRINLWNAGAERLYGYAASEVMGRPLDDLVPEWRVAELRHTREQVMRGKSSMHIETERIRKDGSLVAVAMTISVIHDASGGVIGTSAISHDISDRKRLEARQALLASVSDALSESLDVEATLQQVARLVAPEFADWATVNLIDEHGVLQRLIVTHSNPAKAGLARELMEYPLDPNAGSGTPLAMRSGRTVLHAQLDEDFWAALPASDYVRVQRELGMVSTISTPLIARGKTIGVLGFVYGDSGRIYGEADIFFAEEIARRAATAIDNARLYQASRTAEEEYRAIIDQMPAVMYRAPLGESTIQPYLSPRIEKLLGYTVDEWLSSRELRRAALHPDDRERADADFERRDKEAESTETEYRYITKHGDVVWVHNVAHIVRDAAGKPLYWQGFLTDITQRKLAEAEQQESQQRLRSVVRHSPIGIVTLDRDGVIVTANPAFQNLLGYNEDEMRGNTPAKYIVSLAGVEIPAQFEDLVTGKIDTYQIERQYRRKDGELVWGRLSLSAVRDANGQFLHSVSMVEDITEQRKAEQALRHSEEQFRNAFEDAATGLVFVAFDGTILKANAAFCEMLGRSPSAVVGQKASEFTHPDDRWMGAEHGGTARNDEQRTVSYVKRYLHADGRIVWASLTASVIHDDHGVALHFITQVQDITLQKQAEDALRESEARFRSAFDDAAVGMALFDLDRRFLSVNQALCEMLGYEESDLIGRSASEFSHPDDRDSANPLRDRILTGESEAFQLEKRYVHRDGSTVWCSVSSAVVRADDGTPLYLVTQFQDVTERKLAEDARRKSDERFRAVFDHAPIGIVTLGPDGDIMSANAAFQRMVGYSEEELREGGQSRFVPPDERAAADEMFGSLRRGDIDHYEAESRYARRDGQDIWVRLSISAVRDEDGQFLHSVSMIEDITESRQAQEALRQSEHRFRSLVQNATDVTTILAPDGTILYESQSVYGVLGYDSCELVGKNAFDLIHAEDVREVADAFKRAAADASYTAFLSFRFRHADGSWCWLEVSGRNLLDDPAIEGIVVNSRDVTDRKRFEESQRLLADISVSLSETLDFDVMLQNVARLVVPVIADWCSISVRDEDGSLRRVAVVHHDPSKQELADRLLHHPPSDPDAPFGVPWVARTGETVLTKLFPEDHWDHGDETGQYPIIRALGTESSLLAPLAARGEPIGAIALMYGDSGRRYDERDVPVAEELARRAAIAIDNARLHREVSEAETRFRSLIQHATDMICILDADGYVRYESPAIQRFLGYTPEELVGKHAGELLYPEEWPTVETFLARVLKRPGENLPLTYRCHHKDGEWRWVEATVTNLLDEPGIQGIVINGRDVTERRASEEAIRDSEERFRRAFDDASVGMAVISLDRRLTSVNAALCRMLGYEASELLGKRGVDISHPDDANLLAPHIARVVSGQQQTVQVEKRYLHKNGSTIWCVLSTAAARDQNGEVMYFLSQFQDITERKELELQLGHQALHDSLTGLPNRTLLMDRLDRATSTAKRHGDTVAVLFLDLDNFKLINDSLGHAVGDEVLVGIANRLRRALREEDTVARFGGDEFVVMLNQIDHPSRAIEVAERVLETFRQPLRAQERDVIMTPSIGIALSDGGRHDRDELLRQADIAMYRAKSAGKGSYHVFDADMQGEALQRLELEHDLRRALEREEFALEFQPVVSLCTGKVDCLEALIRWRRPERGVVVPDAFITVAEETGMIVPIGDWVMREACLQAATWQRLAPSENGLRVSVNLSARQFRQPTLADRVREALEVAQLPAHLLVLELTESDLMENADETVQRLRELRSLGVTLAIDDFGTGYSSLSHLHAFPVEVLKIDRSFVSRIGGEQDSTPIVSATVRLAQALGMRSVAEGIETVEQLVALRNEGCDLAQGYYFSPPLAEQDVPRYLAGSGYVGADWLVGAQERV